MNLKQQFQQDMRDAMRVHDRQRVDVIRLLQAAFEHAQEAIGKQAFEVASQAGAIIQPDRHQILSEQVMRDIIRNEMQRRREAADILRAGKQEKRAEREEAEIAILEHYLTKI